MMTLKSFLKWIGNNKLVHDYDEDVDKFLSEHSEKLILSKKPVWIDISGFSGQAHKKAFVGVFQKFVQDNLDFFQSFLEVESPSGRFKSTEICTDSSKLGTLLYDLGKDEVVLRLTGSGAPQEVLVKFDNPEFILKL